MKWNSAGKKKSKHSLLWFHCQTCTRLAFAPANTKRARYADCVQCYLMERRSTGRRLHGKLCCTTSSCSGVINNTHSEKGDDDLGGHLLWTPLSCRQQFSPCSSREQKPPGAALFKPHTPTAADLWVITQWQLCYMQSSSEKSHRSASLLHLPLLNKSLGHRFSGTEKNLQSPCLVSALLLYPEHHGPQ